MVSTMKNAALVLLGTSLSLLLFAQNKNKFTYFVPPLNLTADAMSDGIGQFKWNDLPLVQPHCNVQLKENVTPLTRSMWNIALHDVEMNIVQNSYGSYFAAGRRYTDRVYTRDISFAGVLGLNDLYPKEMLKSIRITRELVSRMKYKVSTEEVIKEIDAPWEAITEDRKQIMAQFKTNSITRRTDDVVWIWAIIDLFEKHPEIADWKWFYSNAKMNFEELYAPWFDKSDGLYKGQNTFHDVMSSAYPVDYSLADCVLLKSTSTNCLYYKGLLAVAYAANKCNLPRESTRWKKKAYELKKAIIKELIWPDGTISYYKDRYGKRMPNQHNLATAFAIIFGIVEGLDAQKAVANYPTTEFGVPLQFPYIENKGDHNQAAWPFCDTFFLIAKEMAEKKDYTDYNAALLARSLGTKLNPNKDPEWGGFGSFHEKIQLPSGLVSGSGAQLWSAAAFINVCVRAKLVEKKLKKVPDSKESITLER